MYSQCLSTNWNIAFSSSPKSNLGIVKRKKMTFKCQLTSWIFRFIDLKNQIFGCSRSRKRLHSAFRELENSIFRFHPERILGWSRGRKWVRSVLQPLETLLSWTHTSRILLWSRDYNEFGMPKNDLKNRFLHLTQVAFWDVQEAENELKVKC